MANAVEVGSVARVTVPTEGELVVALCVALQAESARGGWKRGRDMMEERAERVALSSVVRDPPSVGCRLTPGLPK